MRTERPGRPLLLAGQEACGLGQTMGFPQAAGVLTAVLVVGETQA